MNESTNWGTGFSILFVDDDGLNLELRCKILEHVGCEVSRTIDPVAACVMDLRSFDLIILDFDMPLNGRQLLLALRRQGACCPIMLLSGGLESVPSDTRILFTSCFAKGQQVALFLAEVSRHLEDGRRKDY